MIFVRNDLIVQDMNHKWINDCLVQKLVRLLVKLPCFEFYVVKFFGTVLVCFVYQVYTMLLVYHIKTFSINTFIIFWYLSDDIAILVFERAWETVGHRWEERISVHFKKHFHVDPWCWLFFYGIPLIVSLNNYIGNVTKNLFPFSFRIGNIFHFFRAK